CMQAVGMLPGVSRSGSTLFGGVAVRLNRETAAKFSFMMSAPAIVAGMLSEGYAVMKEGIHIGGDLPAILVGMLVAGVSGYFAIRFFLKLLTKVSLNWFALYVAIIGILVIVLQMTGVMKDAPVEAVTTGLNSLASFIG
ncbi:MAG: undecaprenyl-diphosphate phosphatase, partial [Clostridia bacterium]